MDVCCSLLAEFFNNTPPGCLWNFFIIFIFAWFVSYYVFLICIILYFHVVPFPRFSIQIFWYDAGLLLVVFVFAHFLYHIFVFQWLMDIYFLFQWYLFLDTLAVFIFRFIIIFILITISDWISRASLKVWVTINHVWCFLCCSHFLYTIYYCIGDE